MEHAIWKKLCRGATVLAWAMGVAATMAPAESHAASVVLSASADSIVLDGDASNNLYPGLLASELGTSGPGTVWLSVVKFDLSSLAGMSVSSAAFELTSFTNHSGSPFAHQVYASSDDGWTEDTVTGLNRPADATLTLLDSTVIDGTSRAYSWNVLAGVVGPDGLAGSGNFLTLLLRPDLSQAGNSFGPHFGDRTASSGFPRLLLNATPVPEPATWWLLAGGVLCVARGASRRRPPTAVPA